MLALYEPKNFPYLDEFINSFNSRQCKYYASEIFHDDDLSREIEIFQAIDRAIKACISLNIPVNQHFKTVYKSLEDDVYIDWKLSAFASYLCLINGRPTDPEIARLQVEAIRKFVQAHTL
ncbi:MAG: hypothetical protein ACNS62_19100 [Candidatus Cyclobacteriaceae bacterium M3_2C_046]